jgi:hypothetical protein
MDISLELLALSRLPVLCVLRTGEVSEGERTMEATQNSAGVAALIGTTSLSQEKIARDRTMHFQNGLNRPASQRVVV